EADRLSYRRVGEGHCVNLTRCDLFATAVDQLFQAADQRQVAIRVKHTLVTSAKPAVREGGGVRLGIVVVTVGHVRPLDHHFALSTNRKQSTCLVHDRDLHPGTAPDRAWPSWRRGQRV